jgi:hypothetical protein
VSSFFGTKASATEPVVPETALRVQSSVEGQPIPIGWGQGRLAGNLIGYLDFVATAQQSASSGGKGGSGAGTPTGYNYSATVMIGICEGPIAAFGPIYRDRAVFPLLSDQSFEGFLGGYAQTPWGYLTSLHPDNGLPTTDPLFVPGPGLAFRGLAYVAAGPLQLGSTASIANFSYTITFTINTAIAGIPDANPKDVVVDFLTNVYYGVGFAPARIDALADLGNFCIASGIVISPILTSQVAANSFMADVMVATNSEAFLSGGVLHIKPYWDQPITGNGVTYTPNTTPVYSFGADDFCGEPLVIKRRAIAGIFNSIPLEYLDRDKDYNPVLITAKNAASIQTFGLKPKGTTSLHMICYAPAAITAAAMQLGREALMNDYTFTVDKRYVRTDPMDIVTLTSYSATHGLNLHPVRVKEITRNADGSFTMQAEDLLSGSASPASIAVEPPRGAIPDHNELPGDVAAPIFFEPPFALSGAVEVWGAVHGTDPEWGGCEIWVSADDVTYTFAGKQLGPSRSGTLTAALATPLVIPPALDVVNTLSVDVLASGAALPSASDVAAQALGTICWVDGEVVAYANSTPTGAGQFNLTRLVRAAYGTAAHLVNHPIGSTFIRLDEGVFKVAYQQNGIGNVTHIKFLSFNRYGNAIQSLADVSSYSFTPAGSAYIGSYQAQIDRTMAIATDVSGMLGAGLVQTALIEQAFSAAIAEVDARTANNLSTTNLLASDHRIELINRIALGDDANGASITTVSILATSTASNLASLTTSVASSFTTTNANVATNAAALTTLNTAFSTYTTATAITLGSLSASVTTQSTAIGVLNGIVAAKYSVTLDVNGWASGFSLLNGGGGFSTFTIVASQFQIQMPGYNGSAPQAFFTTGTTNGVASIGLRGNFYLDGTMYGAALVAASVNATRLVAGTVTSASGVIGNLSVTSFSIADHAVTVPQLATQVGVAYCSTGSFVNALSATVVIDTTGLDGKTITVYANCFFQGNWFAGNTSAMAYLLDIDGSTVTSWSTIVGQTVPSGTLTGGKSYTVGVGVTSISAVITIKVSGTGTGAAGSTTNSLSNANIFALACKR